MKKSLLCASGVSAFVLFGCTDQDGTYNNTVNGALIGAATGAATGLLVADDENDRTAAIAGGAIGGIAGGAIGAKLDQQEEALRQDLAGSGALIVNTGDRLIVTLPEAITFPVDSAVVKSSLIGPLATLAGNLNDYPQTNVQVVGHTDNTGSQAHNQTLSERRADAVATILVGNGVSLARVQTVGMGENVPIASNDTEEGRQRNRRVEINIIPVSGY